MTTVWNWTQLMNIISNQRHRKMVGTNIIFDISKFALYISANVCKFSINATSWDKHRKATHVMKVTITILMTLVFLKFKSKFPQVSSEKMIIKQHSTWQIKSSNSINKNILTVSWCLGCWTQTRRETDTQRKRIPPGSHGQSYFLWWHCNQVADPNRTFQPLDHLWSLLHKSQHP